MTAGITIPPLYQLYIIAASQLPLKGESAKSHSTTLSPVGLQCSAWKPSLIPHLPGRVSSTGFLPTTPRPSKNRDTISSTSIAVPPEEALFRRRGAPERFEEDDFYWANRYLKDDQILPDSDLLTAVHEYASDFYGRSYGGGTVDFMSMDETALIAVGVLLEEWAATVGREGWRAFVEGEEREKREGEKETEVSEDSGESEDEESTIEIIDGRDDGERGKRKRRNHRNHRNRKKNEDIEASSATNNTSSTRQHKRRKVKT